jgi:very-short-patch-repair endonuclease
MSPAEKKLWSRIRGSQLAVRFRRQQPVGPYVVDFLCAVANVVIELDGDSHDSTQEEDKARDALLADMGLRVLRIANAEVFDNIDGVLARLAEVVRDASR